MQFNIPKIAAVCILTLGLSTILCAQEPEDIYRDRTDSLDAVVFTGARDANYISRNKDIRTEVITAAGLCKLACCSLAESFENSASVTVGYSDAVTGARQIKLLGLGGNYTQLLDEARPSLRGLLSPFALTYIPGAWMESIQIAKGATSVMNGTEAITGSINIEHRKPTDEKPLFVNFSIMDDTKSDLNVISSLQFNDRVSTVLMGHVSGNFKSMDHNGDGFVDDPDQLQINVANRWLVFDPESGAKTHFGVKFVRDTRKGGELLSDAPGAWTSNIRNSLSNAYYKYGAPVGTTSSAAIVADLTTQRMDSQFGAHTLYKASQSSLYVNAMYQGEFEDHHRIVAGLSAIVDSQKETYQFSYKDGIHSSHGDPLLFQGGAYGEYTFREGDTFSMISSLRADWFNRGGWKLIPRLTLKYSPSETITLRANGGRGLRYASPITDNIGVLSTTKYLTGDFCNETLEDSWIGGANATWYYWGESSNYLSVDFFHTQFTEQLIVDYNDPTSIAFYRLSSLEGGRAFTDNVQLDFSIEPIERFTITTTLRYTLAKSSYRDLGLVTKPMTSLYKGVLNLQYATNLNKWIFDGTLSVNGPCEVYGFMKDIYPEGRTPVYPLLYLQITHRMKGWDIYLGGENLLGFRQEKLLIGTPGELGFDASQVWGPIMGAKIYLGMRFTIWKTS